MEKVLIYKDQHRIDRELEYMEQVIDCLQELYDQFKSIGISVSLKELVGLLNATMSTNPRKGALEELVVTKLLDKAGEPNFNGVLIQRAKLKELISVPDLSLIEATIQEFTRFHQPELGIRTELLELVNEVVIQKPDAKTKLEEMFTHLTKTEKTAQMAGCLNNICDALNTWEENYGNQVNFGAAHDEEWIPGIRRLNKRFVVDLQFIRRQEQLN